MNTNILLTGGRSPATLNLARMLKRTGYTVFVAESESYHLCNSSNAVKSNTLVPKPNEDYEGYINSLKQIIKDNDIAVLIPTCEEIFHVAKAKDDICELGVNIFCDDISKLNKLHNKWEFIQLLKGYNFDIPETIYITSQEELEQILSNSNKKVVIKAIYSRFASNVYILDKGDPIPKIDITINIPWIVQEFIDGTQYCSYSVVKNGDILAHTCYGTKYTAGLGANVYFKHVDEERIFDFVKKVSKEINFTGQIAFDFFIDKNDRVYPIECNPRTTSGLHLFDRNNDFIKALLDENVSVVTPKGDKCFKLGIPMLMYGLNQGYILRNPIQFFKDFINADDVVLSYKDMKPYLYQIVIFCTLMYRKILSKKKLTELTTVDIEWGGDL